MNDGVTGIASVALRDRQLVHDCCAALERLVSPLILAEWGSVDGSKMAETEPETRRVLESLRDRINGYLGYDFDGY